MDDGNGNEIIKFDNNLMEYLGIEYAPRTCGYFCCGDCLLDPKPDGTYRSCNNRCQFKYPL